jgi:hypothetical protein
MAGIELAPSRMPVWHSPNRATAPYFLKTVSKKAVLLQQYGHTHFLSIFLQPMVSANLSVLLE